METQIMLALASFAVSIIGLIHANRCRDNPEHCARRFISRFGAPQSIFAIKYAGEPELARRAIREDEILRRRYIVEQYVSAAAIAIAGFLLLFVRL